MQPRLESALLEPLNRLPPRAHQMEPLQRNSAVHQPSVMAMQCRAARGDKGNSPLGLQADFTRINSPQPIAW